MSAEVERWRAAADVLCGRKLGVVHSSEWIAAGDALAARVEELETGLREIRLYLPSNVPAAVGIARDLLERP